MANQGGRTGQNKVLLSGSIHEVQCFQKTDYQKNCNLETSKATIKFDREKIVIDGPDTKSVKSLMKTVQTELGKLKSVSKDIDSTEGQFLTKESVKTYINQKLGIEAKPVSWGVDVVIGQDTLIVFALTEKEAKRIKKEIRKCIVKCVITLEQSKLDWFTKFLKSKPELFDSNENKKTDEIVIYTTSELHSEYIQPNLNSSTSEADKKTHKSPSPGLAPGTNSIQSAPRPVSRHESNGGKPKRPNSKRSKDQTPEPDYPTESVQDVMYVKHINIGELELKYLQKYHSQELADLSETSGTTITNDDGLNVKGNQRSIEIFDEKLQNLLKTTVVSNKQEVAAGKPSIPGEIRNEWDTMEKTECCMIDVDRSKEPRIKSGWIIDRDKTPRMDFLYMEGEVSNCPVDVMLYPVNKNLEPIGRISQELQNQLLTQNAVDKTKAKVGTPIVVYNPDDAISKCVIFHVLDSKIDKCSEESKIKVLVEKLINVLYTKGFRKVGFCLRYTKHANWMDFSCKLVQSLWLNRDRLGHVVTVYCFGDDEDFNALDSFLIKEVKINKILGTFVTEPRSRPTQGRSSIDVQIIEGSILEFKKTDVIVNSVKTDLDLKFGIVAQKLLEQAGPEIQKECDKFGEGKGIDLGDIAYTSSGKLSYKKIFHVALYTEWSNNGEVAYEILRTVMMKCLKEAERKKYTSIAFPALGTGKLGYSPCLVAKTMLGSVEEFGRTGPKHLKNVTLVVFNDKKSNSDIVLLFRDVYKWLKSREIFNRGYEWDLPPRHVTCISRSTETRLMVTDQDYYSRMVYRDFRVVLGSSGKSVDDIKTTWDESTGCYHTRVKVSNSPEALKRDFRAVLKFIQGNKLHVTDLFLQTGVLALEQLEILEDELEIFPSSLLSKSQKGQKKKQEETNYIKMIRVFFNSDEMKNIEVSVNSGDLNKKSRTWYSTNLQTFPFTVTVVGKKDRVDKVLDKVVKDVSSLQATSNQTWQVKHKETSKVKDLVKKASKEMQIEFNEGCNTVTCEGTAKQIESINDKLKKYVELNLEIEMSSDEYKTLIHITCDDNWRLKVKNRYDKGKGVFELTDSGNLAEIKSCVSSKLKHIQQLSSEVVSLPGPFEGQFSTLQYEIESIDQDLYCILSHDKNRILIRAPSYELAQRAKYVAEVNLGIIQQTRRRNRVIASEEIGRGPSNTQTDNKFTSIKQGKSYRTKEGINVFVYSAGIGGLNVDTLVNAANKDLQHGGGIAYHISNAAGYALDRECDDYIRSQGPLGVGTCCATTAGNLPYKSIIHAVGPMWHSYPHNKKQQCLNDLKGTIVSSLVEADSQGLRSIAIPSISSGIFGVPKEVCAQQYYEGVVEFSRSHPSSSIEEIHFIDRDKAMTSLIQKTFDDNF